MTAVMNVVMGDDKRERCWWGASTPDYVAYHDDEWGFGVADDHRLFEKLCLEGFQSGLSWLTILRKRENFRAAFAGFDPRVVADFDETRCRPVVGRRRDRSASGQDPLDHQQRVAGARADRRVRIDRRLHVAACNVRRSTDGVAAVDTDVDCDLQGSEEARLDVRRADHRLRVHAGHGSGQRPRSKVAGSANDPRQARRKVYRQHGKGET